MNLSWQHPRQTSLKQMEIKRTLQTRHEHTEEALIRLAQQFGPFPAGEDTLKILSLYALFTNTTMSYHQYAWAFTKRENTLQKEIDHLKTQISLLRRQQTSPPSDTFKELSADTVDRFMTLAHQPRWMREISQVLSGHVRKPGNPEHALKKIWDVMVEHHFRYATDTYSKYTRSRGSNHQPKLSLDQAISQAGLIQPEEQLKASHPFSPSPTKNNTFPGVVHSLTRLFRHPDRVTPVDHNTGFASFGSAPLLIQHSPGHIPRTPENGGIPVPLHYTTRWHPRLPRLT